MESPDIDFSTFDALLKFLFTSPLVPLIQENTIFNLVIFKTIFIDPPQDFVENGSLQVIESVVRKVGSIFSSFDLKKMNEYMGLELCVQLCNFISLDENTLDYQRIMVERPKLSPSGYPKTSHFVFINHLLENLEELLQDTTSSTLPFNYIILRIQRELRFWYSDLIEISSNPPLFTEEITEAITKLAYDVEYVLDLFQVGDIPSWRCIFWLFDILQHFLQIEQEERERKNEEDLNTIINDKLLGGGEQLNITTIVSSTTIGKIAFINELYNSPSVIDHFDSRARCCLDYRFRQSLLEIVGYLVDISDIILSKDYEELAKLLYEYLEGQRFLIVIDVEAIEDWVEIRRWFPDTCNGSRIVLTTEIRDFAFTTR